MNFKNTIIFIVTLSTAIKAAENFDDYTVFSGTAGIRMSQSEDMAECKQRCTRGAQQDALYNFFWKIILTTILMTKHSCH